MNIDDAILKSEERVVFRLREIYRRHGYACFKMSKFEEYDLYGQNKDFLVSDSVITFNDTDGKLMALKPDVTLSIVKNHKNGSGVQRVYYNENVYRISGNTHCYKEIMQMGLELLGDGSEYSLFEVASLAAKSLACISEKCLLNISHLGVLSAILALADAGDEKKELLSCIGEKNAHGVRTVCGRCGISKEQEQLLVLLTESYGEPEKVISRFKDATKNREILSALEQLRRVAKRVEETSGVTVRVDLSLVNDINYYNGLVFSGFVEGIPASVLSGGQYDKLMAKMGKDGSAVGFAVYLDLLERMRQSEPYDVDVLLLYCLADDPAAVQDRAEELIAEGKSVSVQMEIPSKLAYREFIRFEGGKENV